MGGTFGDKGGAFGGLSGMGGGMDQMDPEMMKKAMNNPMIQSLMVNRNFMREMMMSNPQMRQIIENNPEMDDTELIRRSMEIDQNPELMREMMRNSDRAMSNISSMPGGFDALRRLYMDVQEPLHEATVDMTRQTTGSNSNYRSSTTN